MKRLFLFSWTPDAAYGVSFSIIVVAIFFLFFSGIIRHDVPEAKYHNLANQKQFKCVGKVYNMGQFVGSCVLIKNRFVLTAAHNFIESDKRADTTIRNGDTTIMFTSINERISDPGKFYFDLNGEKSKAKSITIHPGYFGGSTNECCDIAVVELVNPYLTIPKPKLNNSLDELSSNVIGVGFGASGIADNPKTVKLEGKKIAGENVIDSIGGPYYSGHQTLLICDFDNLKRKDCNKTGSPVPRPLEYMCSGGDSGGGLFRKKNKTWELVGLCHGSRIDTEQFLKTGYYGQIMDWIRISNFTDWINTCLNNKL